MALTKAKVRHVTMKTLKLPDPLALENKKPGFRYRWVEEERVEALKTIGYALTETLGKDAPKTFGGKKDGTPKHGNLVLMCQPEEDYQERADLKEAINSKRESSEEAIADHLREEQAGLNTKRKMTVAGDGVKTTRELE